MAWTFNLWGIPEKDKDAKEPIPDICVFCGVPIKEDDVYWIGYDRHQIFAMTCNGLYCKGWLKWKVKRKKE